MTRSKPTSHTRHSTPARRMSRIHTHTSPTRNKFRHPLHPNLKRKHTGISYRPGNNSEDTYLSLLRSLQETENDDDASSDGTGSDASIDDQLEGWDEETTLVEMLGCPYSNPSPSRILLIGRSTANTMKNRSFKNLAVRLRTLPMACARI